jgi:hypothetical protein
MKNIHLIKTDNPSRLHLGDSGLVLCDFYFSRNTVNGQNIYITSDEEIKIEDYAYHKVFGVGKIIYVDGKDCFVTLKTKPTDGSVTTPWKRNIPDIRKIILTTDQDLIADGIQEIDDEFLEWFVKNPSCEFVEVNDIKTIPSLQLGSPNGHLMYKIIIPQKELKQSSMNKDSIDKFLDSLSDEELKEKWNKYNKHSKQENSVTISEFIKNIKQETLEEAAERLTYNDNLSWENNYAKESFIQGAKYQAERMYSEEEVIKILLDKNAELGLIYKTSKVVEWFEQFKKK